MEKDETFLVRDFVPTSTTDMLSPSAYIISSLFLLLIWIFGSIGNFLVLFLVFKNKELRTPINMLLVNVAIFDFLMSFLGAPFPMIAAFLREWPFGDRVCILYGFGMSFGGIGSITTLMVLAFERYLIIARPFRITRIKMNQMAGMVAAIWIYTAILTVPPLLGWGKYGYEGPKISCSVDWESGGKLNNSYISFLFMMGFFLPLFVIAFASFQIIRTLRKASANASGSVASRAELHVIILIAVMITGFVAAWTPYAILSLLVTFWEIRPSPSLAVIPALIAKSSCTYNPVIYVGLNTQFRGAWAKLLGFPDRSGRDGTERATTTGGRTCGARIVSSHTTSRRENKDEVGGDG